MAAKYLVLLFLICIGLACVAGLAVGVYVVGGILAELLIAMRPLLRRPQFGVRHLFSLTVVIALACAMLRSMGVVDFFGAAITASILLVWAVGIVCGAEFAVSDFISQYRPQRQRRDEQPLELWDEAPPPQPLFGEASSPQSESSEHDVAACVVRGQRTAGE